MMVGQVGIPDHNDSTHRATGVNVIETADVSADTHREPRRRPAGERVDAW
ncbi:hypothetical protein [Nonomuraea sp. B5E05]